MSEVCKHKWINVGLPKKIGGQYWEMCANCNRVRKIRLTSKIKYKRN